MGGVGGEETSPKARSEHIPMPKLCDLTEAAILEYIRLETAESIREEVNPRFPFPRMIAVGDRQSVVISEAIEKIIIASADVLIAENNPVLSKVKLTELQKIVRTAFGEYLEDIDVSESPCGRAKEMAQTVRARVTEEIERCSRRETVFGCALFSEPDIRSFELGPLRFENRSDWLERKCSEGAISNVTRRRIESAWAGHRLRKRKPSNDSLFEKEIVRTIGNCRWVCTVVTVGLSTETALERAATAARLGLLAVALCWPRASQALDRMRLAYDGAVYQKNVIAFGPTNAVLTKSSISGIAAGLPIKGEEWNAFVFENSDYFYIISEILGFFVGPKGDYRRADISSALAQSLLWFHDGCQETSDLVGVVKHSAALDALAGGNKSAGIKKLVEARLGIPPGEELRTGGLTMGRLINEIYNEGRSRSIHGTNTRFTHDWSGIRYLAERLAESCIHACIDYVATDPSVTDLEKLREPP